MHIQYKQYHYKNTAKKSSVSANKKSPSFCKEIFLEGGGYHGADVGETGGATVGALLFGGVMLFSFKFSIF